MRMRERERERMCIYGYVRGKINTDGILMLRKEYFLAGRNERNIIDSEVK